MLRNFGKDTQSAYGQPEALFTLDTNRSQRPQVQDLDLGRPQFEVSNVCKGRGTPSGTLSKRTLGPCCRVVTPPSGGAQDKALAQISAGRVSESPEEGKEYPLPQIHKEATGIP